MIVFAVSMRLLTFKFQFMSNFTPVGAIALFGGAYFTDKWKAFLIPILALFGSDMLINSFYHINMFTINYWVYISFIIMVFIGMFIKNVYIFKVVLASLAGVLVHWLLTDIGPWLHGTLYAKGLMGYGQSLVAAIPFERNMILGDLVYGTLLFGGFELAKSKYVFLRDNKSYAL
jgi:hypothetical protein